MISPRRFVALASASLLLPVTAAAAQDPPIPLSLDAPSTMPASTQPDTPSPADGDDALPHSIVLKSGERVTGRIVSRDENEIVVASDGLGVVTVKQSNVAEVINPTGQAETKAEQVEAAKDEGLFRTGFLRDWDRQIELGLTGTTGTTDSAAFNAQFNASEDNDSYRATFGAWYFLTKTNATIDRNQTRVFGTFDKRLDGGPWFVFARGQYDNDSLQLWENRVSGFAGPGYEFIKTERVELLGRIGLGYTHEFGGNTPSDYDDSRFEALVGVDYKWVIDPTQSIVASSYLTPSLDDITGEGRVVSNLAYQVDLNKAHGFGVRMGVEHSYDFKTPGDDSHNNFKYFVNLLMKL